MLCFGKPFSTIEISPFKKESTGKFLNDAKVYRRDYELHLYSQRESVSPATIPTINGAAVTPPKKLALAVPATRAALGSPAMSFVEVGCFVRSIRGVEL